MRIFKYFIINVLIAAALGYMSYFISRDILESEIKDRYFNDAHNSIDAIGKIMLQNYVGIISVSKDELLKKDNIGLKELMEFLKTKKDVFGFESLSYFDTNRIRIADTEDVGVGERHPMEGFWYDILNGNITSGSDVRLGSVRKYPVIYFAAPVYNREGKIKNVLVGRADYAKLNKEITKVQRPGVYTIIFNKDRDVIFSNHPYYKDKLLKEKIAESLFVKEALKGGEGVISEHSPFLEGEFLIAYVQEKGHEEFKGNNWVLGIFVEKSKIFAPINSLGILILVLSMAAILLSSGLGIFIASTITKPIANLRDAAIKIGKGNLDTKIRVEAKNEIGDLAKAFDQMTGNLKRSREELEDYSKNLEAKTKELSMKNIELNERESAMMNLLEDARILEKKIKKERDYFQAVISSIGEGLIIIDIDSKITLINSTAEKLLDASAALAIGCDIEEIISFFKGEEKISRELSPAMEAQKTKKTIVADSKDNFYFQTRLNKKFPVIFTIIPFFKDNNINTIIIFHDITEEKR